MKTNNKKTSALTSSSSSQERLGSVIKLGIDVHANSYSVSMKIDGSCPQRPIKMAPAKFLGWAAKHIARCDKLYSCYEAGAFGYVLHRELLKLGAVNHVIRPVKWDEHNTRVKTDGRDCEQMVLALEHYLAGNRRSFSVVAVPSEKAERERSRCRQREALVRERVRLAAQGRGNARHFGHPVKGQWWKPRRLAELEESLPEHVLCLLRPLAAVIAEIDRQSGALDKAIAERPAPPLPKGMGPTIHHAIEGEIGDWARFPSARKVASYTGLCPGEDSSGGKRRQGPASKHGNRRLRASLVGLVWLLMKWNPGYIGLAKWEHVLADPKATGPRRRKAVVAIARQLAVDLWKLRAGKASAEDLGLEMKPAKA